MAFGSGASRRSDRLIEIDPGTGKQRTLLAGVEHRSLSAVAAGNAAVLRRNGDREQLLLVPLSIANTYEPVDGSAEANRAIPHQLQQARSRLRGSR